MRGYEEQRSIYSISKREMDITFNFQTFNKKFTDSKVYKFLNYALKILNQLFKIKSSKLVNNQLMKCNIVDQLCKVINKNSPKVMKVSFAKYLKNLLVLQDKKMCVYFA